jgi:hypothetical protein
MCAPTSTQAYGAAAVPILEPDERALAAVLVAEVDHRRRAAKGRRLGSCRECVDGARCAELPVEMRVNIDPARKHQQARGVMDGNIRTDGQVHADGMDAAVTRQDVRLIVVDRRDDPAIPDERRCHLIHPLAGGGLKLRCGDSLRQRNSKVPSSLTPTRREGKLIACATRGHGQGPQSKNGQSRRGRRPVTDAESGVLFACSIDN